MPHSPLRVRVVCEALSWVGYGVRPQNESYPVAVAKKMMDDYLSALKNEFEAGSGTFLLQLRPNLEWDKAAFTRLIAAMQACCEQYSHNDKLDRWIAESFWYIPTFVRDWTTHPNFPRVHGEDYYEKAYRRLDDLAYWFFCGESPYLGNTGFDPM